LLGAYQHIADFQSLDWLPGNKPAVEIGPVDMQRSLPAQVGPGIVAIGTQHAGPGSGPVEHTAVVNCGKLLEVFQQTGGALKVMPRKVLVGKSRMILEGRVL